MHWPGRTHSNVDPLSRLPCTPHYISPAREDLLDPKASTEHDDLQQAWETFIKEQELAVESKTVTTCSKGKGGYSAETLPSNVQPVTQAADTEPQASKGVRNSPSAIHIHANQETVRWFAEAYTEDKDFAAVLKRTLGERLQDQKYCAYCLASNGLMYFEDADGQVRLCIPSTERATLIKNV